MSPRPGPLHELVAARLASYRYPVDTWTVPVAEQICAVLDTPLCDTEAGPQRSARVFREFPSAALPRRYADAVGRLGFIPLAGFLRGFIDLVFRHGERFYLVDYKGNHLGASAADYAPEKLGDAMLRGQYFLQYHLYALALHRYLGRRLPGYSFERHFGGVFYLFIKGMAPEHGAAGVFYEKPPLERVEALGRLFERVPTGAAGHSPRALFGPGAKGAAP